MGEDEVMSNNEQIDALYKIMEKSLSRINNLEKRASDCNIRIFKLDSRLFELENPKEPPGHRPAYKTSNLEEQNRQLTNENTHYKKSIIELMDKVIDLQESLWCQKQNYYELQEHLKK